MKEWAVDMPAHHALRDALITNREYIHPKTKEALWPIVGKYLG